MEQKENCPTEIINSIKLWVVNYLIGLALTIFYWNDFFKIYGNITPLLVNQILISLIIALLLYKIYQGKNWARIIWLIALMIGLIFSFGSVLNSTFLPIILKIHAFISILLNIFIFYVVFISPSKSWFSRNSKKTAGYSNSNHKKNSQITALIDEQDWENALNEFESLNRKKGLYAQCFSRANGNDNFAKAEYLAIRSEEIFHDRASQITQQISTTSNESLNLNHKINQEAKKSNELKIDLILGLSILIALIIPASFFVSTVL